MRTDSLEFFLVNLATAGAVAREMVCRALNADDRRRWEYIANQIDALAVAAEHRS